MLFNLSNKFLSSCILWYRCNIFLLNIDWLGWFLVFNTTFENISVKSWRSVLLVEETGVGGENHRPVASH